MSTKIRFILASASPARRHVLEEAGLSPEIMAVDLDEAAVIEAVNDADAETNPRPTVSPKRLVSTLACEKARKCAEDLDLSTPSTLILGCDSMLEVNGEVVGKPHTSEVAVERIKQLRNNWVTLWTGHHLIRLDTSGSSHGAHKPRVDVRHEAKYAVSTRIKFGDLSDGEIAAYVATGEPLEVAGAFTLDGRGSAFIEQIEGDPQNVIGVSVYTLRQLAKELGVFWPDLWRPRA